MNMIIGVTLLLIFIIGELVMMSLEHGYKTIPWKEIVTNVNSGHIMLMLSRAFVLFGYQFVLTHWSIGIVSMLPVWGIWIFTVFAWDFCYYWSHRTHHTIPFMWHIHHVHHQGEHFNLSLGIRNSWYQPYTSFPFYIGLAILGVPIEVFVIVSAVHYFIQFYNHNGIVNKSGFLEKILITPSHHRVHHGSNPEYINKNHGGTFVFWDKLFGTFQEERTDIEIRYGVTDRLNPMNPLWANLKPLFKYFKFKIRIPKARYKLQIKDWYIVSGSFLLYLMLLFYVNFGQVWSIQTLGSLFFIVFVGTLHMGSIAEKKAIGLVFWIVLSLIGTTSFLIYSPIDNSLLTYVVMGVMLHGILGLLHLIINKPIVKMSTPITP